MKAKSWKKIARKRSQEQEQEQQPEQAAPGLDLFTAQQQAQEQHQEQDLFSIAEKVAGNNDKLQGLLSERSQLEQQMGALAQGQKNASRYENDPRFAQGEVPSHEEKRRRDKAWADRRDAFLDRKREREKAEKAFHERQDQRMQELQKGGEEVKKGGQRIQKEGQQIRKNADHVGSGSLGGGVGDLLNFSGSKGQPKGAKSKERLDVNQASGALGKLRKAANGLESFGNKVKGLEDQMGKLKGPDGQGMDIMSLAKDNKGLQSLQNLGEKAGKAGKKINDLMDTASDAKNKYQGLKRRVGQFINPDSTDSGMEVSVADRWKNFVKNKMSTDNGSLEGLGSKQDSLRERIMAKRRQEKQDEERREKQREKRRNKDQ